MSKPSTDEEIKFDKIPFKIHPRIFSSLGTDLVTDDVVALIELVKNSYDAFASNVYIRFKKDEKGKGYIEVEDDGLGMTKDVVEKVWCLVATPNKEKNTQVVQGKKKRRVVGEKGLGRLSAARLGKRLQMITQAPNAKCLEVIVNWNDLTDQSDVSHCFAEVREYPVATPFTKSGTLIKIFDLNEIWEPQQILDLEDNLGRLVSPFEKKSQLNIFVLHPGNEKEEVVKIQPPPFLNKPKYVIQGIVDRKGNVRAKYKFNPIIDGKPRSSPLKLTWGQICKSYIDNEKTNLTLDQRRTHCGPFVFQIRAWDVNTEGTEEIAEAFDFPKNKVRKSIKAHKGISVYRDGILVLPKSENAKDWLGLDLRRVSRVGNRLSTSQIVGYVSISKKRNPQIDDTIDRERLIHNQSVTEFEVILKSVVMLLEQEREQDRNEPGKKKQFDELFSRISADNLVREVKTLVEEGAEVREVLPIIRAYKDDLDDTREEIKKRFIYYSRMANVGTVAQVIVHEIRNHTSAIGMFLATVYKTYMVKENKVLDEVYRHADSAVDTLEHLADEFAPLANQAFRKRINKTILEERIRATLDYSYLKGDLHKKGIECVFPNSETQVAIDPAELDTILLNLVLNSIYWLDQVDEKKKKIIFKCRTIDSGNRIRVWVHDNGPGLTTEDAERVFLPGFTKKPGGIGMGLAVASQLVSEYGGQMLCETPGELGGASFGFDVPLAN